MTGGFWRGGAQHPAVCLARPATPPRIFSARVSAGFFTGCRAPLVDRRPLWRDRAQAGVPCGAGFARVADVCARYANMDALVAREVTTPPTPSHKPFETPSPAVRVCPTPTPRPVCAPVRPARPPLPHDPGPVAELGGAQRGRRLPGRHSRPPGRLHRALRAADGVQAQGADQVGMWACGHENLIRIRTEMGVGVFRMGADILYRDGSWNFQSGR